MQKDFNQIIYYATKAPSGHNTQPWKFQIEDDTIIIQPDLSRSLPIVDPDNHALFISLGCALENLLIAASHFGYQSNVQLHTGENPLIRVTIREGKGIEENKLFSQIEIRQSTRNTYNGEPIPEEHISLLLETARQENTRCMILTKKEEIEPVTALVMEGCEKQFRNPAFVHELAHWIRFSRSQANKTHDGLTSASTGNPYVPEWFGKLVMGVTASPQKEAKKCAALIKSSSALALFIAEKDDVQSWINIGRSFERFALTATALNIHHAHVNMPCEEREVRQKLSRLLHVQNDEQPLLLVRIGYSEKMPYSYRRPVEEVIVNHSKTLVYE
jgi:nitroreductase